MRRVAVIIVLLAVAGAAAMASGAGKDSSASGKRFTIELDNAFGLVKGADLKVAGVRAGTITGMRVDRRTKRALVDIEIAREGFGSFRSDVFCESRPQSLIGEYFIDCLPGKAAQELPAGSTIRVDHTASTIPGDLVQNIMRRPERERLRIILNELGAGVGARAEDIQATVRRGVPALRETDRVLAVLGRQNQVLADLVRNGDEVIHALSGNRRDVTRWVKETRETAAASAERRAAIAEGLRKLPDFLRELRPTMAELGNVAVAQQPSLRDLNASAGELERLFTNLKPFAQSTQVNLRSLGRAAREGDPAVRAAKPVIAELDRFTTRTPELANNLAIVLRDLDDRNRAVEPDPHSPGGKGYTGFEALLEYVFEQALAINVYNANGYMLKANLFHSECSDYQNAESLKKKMAEDPKFYERCHAILGPSQQGVLQPDPTAKPGARAKARRRANDEKDSGADTPAGTPETPVSAKPGEKPPIDLGGTLGDLLQGALPNVKTPDVTSKVPDVGLGDSRATDQALFDFLFGR
jgi:ABC-type transporter Mla subunit MlaD